jgi:hypothetical protein
MSTLGNRPWGPWSTSKVGYPWFLGMHEYNPISWGGDSFRCIILIWLLSLGALVSSCITNRPLLSIELLISQLTLDSQNAIFDNKGILLGSIHAPSCGYLGIKRFILTGGSFLSIISATTYSRWPPSWILFPSIIWLTPQSTGPIFWWLIWGEWRKVSFNDQHCCSIKMATAPAILDLVPINYLTNVCVNWSDFLVAYWGWLEVGSCRWSVLPPIQDGSHLGFGSRPLSDERLSRLVRFFGAEGLCSLCDAAIFLNLFVVQSFLLHFRYDDGLVEVMGLYSSFHVAQLVVGVTEPYRFGQAKVVKVCKFCHCTYNTKMCGSTCVRFNEWNNTDVDSMISKH